MSITFTEKAAEKMKFFRDKTIDDLLSEGKLKQEDKAKELYGFRLAIQGGGCSGMQYAMSITPKIDNDKVFENQGVKLYVDFKSYLFLNNCEIDWVETLLGAGFKINNPNAKGSCGCGESFTT